MTEPFDGPPDLEELDRRLRAINFAPRASLGPEVVGRIRHGETFEPRAPRWPRRGVLLGIAASVALAIGASLFLWHPAPVVVDRCCYDLDGGGDADDGVVVLAERDSRVHRLRVYEDRDKSGSFSAGDVVRLDRGRLPSMLNDSTAYQLVTTQHCCLDFDGGGPSDDALLVIGVPPDRVMMAAIYERRIGPRRGTAARDFELR